MKAALNENDRREKHLKHGRIVLTQVFYTIIEIVSFPRERKIVVVRVLDGRWPLPKALKTCSDVNELDVDRRVLGLGRPFAIACSDRVDDRYAILLLDMSNQFSDL